MKKHKTKFYHCSPKRFRKGDILVCPSSDDGRNYNCGGLDGIWIHTHQVPHFTIWDKISERDKKWFLYEVEPIGKIYQGMWDDIICDRAEVVRLIGDAYSIMVNWQNRNWTPKKARKWAEWKEKYPTFYRGNMPYPDGYSIFWCKDLHVSRKEWKSLKKKW